MQEIRTCRISATPRADTVMAGSGAATLGAAQMAWCYYFNSTLRFLDERYSLIFYMRKGVLSELPR